MDVSHLPGEWKIAVKELVMMPAGELLANPDNWRIHPSYQQQAMQGMLDEAGWWQCATYNTVTGHLVDGHMRAILALRKGGEDELVPTLLVEGSIEDERKVLATMDPISALAAPDAAKLSTLLADLPARNAGAQKLLDDLRKRADSMLGVHRASDGAPADLDETADQRPAGGTDTRQFRIVVNCESDEQRSELLEYLSSEGIDAHAVG